MGFSYRDIEDWLRYKWQALESSPPQDWDYFERKLRRAIFWRRLKFYGGSLVFTLLLTLLSRFILAPGGFAAESSPEAAPSSRPEASAIVPTETQEPIRRETQKAIALGPKGWQKLVTTPKRPLVLKAVYAPRPTAQSSLASLAPRSLSAYSPEAPKLRARNLKSAPARHRSFTGAVQSEDALPYQPYISPMDPQREWYYSLNFYPNFAFRRFSFSRSQRDYLHSDFIDATQSSERSGMSINVGFELSRRIGPITYVNSGLDYITNGYRADYRFTNFREAVLDPESGRITSYNIFNNPREVQFRDMNRFHYLNLPLSISHRPWVNDYLRLNLEFGFNLLYFISASGSTLDYTSLEVIDISERPYRQFLGSAQLALGVHYFVNPRMNLGIEPTLLYFTHPIYSEAMPFKVVPFTVGLNLSLQYQLALSGRRKAQP